MKNQANKQREESAQGTSYLLILGTVLTLGTVLAQLIL